MKHYIEKDPNDPYSVMKAVFYANSNKYFFNTGVRVCFKFLEIFKGALYLEVIRAFEQHEGAFTVEQMYYPLALGALKVLIDSF
jgi:hypothetical protein